MTARWGETDPSWRRCFIKVPVWRCLPLRSPASTPCSCQFRTVCNSRLKNHQEGRSKLKNRRTVWEKRKRLQRKLNCTDIYKLSKSSRSAKRGAAPSPLLAAHRLLLLGVTAAAAGDKSSCLLKIGGDLPANPFKRL